MLALIPCIGIGGTYLGSGGILSQCIDSYCYWNSFLVCRKYCYIAWSEMPHQWGRTRSGILERGQEERHLVGDSSHGKALDHNLAHTLGIKDLVPLKEIGYIFS